MEKTLHLEIYNQLVDFLARRKTLKEFRGWFDASTWQMHELGANQDALELASQIELRLSEFSYGHWTEDELQAKLIPLVRAYAQTEQSWGTANSWYRTSCSSVTVTQGADLGSPVDIRASVVFV